MDLDNVRNDWEMYCILGDQYVNYLLKKPSSKLGSVNFVKIKATTRMQFLFVLTIWNIEFH